jgi:hypothetical protein
MGEKDWGRTLISKRLGWVIYFILVINPPIGGLRNSNPFSI